MNAPLVGADDVAAMVRVARATPKGAFIEVGVYKGDTAWHLAKLADEQHRAIFLCDTFTGIPHADPDKGDSHVIGDFSDTGMIETMARVPFAAYWIMGVFPQSMEHTCTWELDRGIAFAHLDVDQYRSYIEAFDWLVPRMLPGGVIWMDDVDKLAGATRAAVERFGDRILRVTPGRPHVRF